jgi:hypothetical protein
VTSTTRRARGLPALDRLRTCSGVSDRPRRGAGVPCCALTSSHLGLRSVAPPAERRGSTGWSGSRGSSLRTQDPVPPPTRQGCRQLGLIAACQMWTPGSTSCPFLAAFARFAARILRFFTRTSGFKSPSSHFETRVVWDPCRRLSLFWSGEGQCCPLPRAKTASGRVARTVRARER